MSETEETMIDSAVVERARTALMKRHHHEWEMETVSEAAHLIARVVASTDRTEAQALREIDRAVSAFRYDSVRQRVIEALGQALDVPRA